MRQLIVALCLVLGLGLVGCDNRRGDPPRPVPAAKIDLNRATIREIETLPEIGPVKAKQIMASRNARGGKFERLEDLLQIDGIGEKTLDAIRPHVVLEPK